jgi:hypothetical protein
MPRLSLGNSQMRERCRTRDALRCGPPLSRDAVTRKLSGRQAYEECPHSGVAQYCLLSLPLVHRVLTMSPKTLIPYPQYGRGKRGRRSRADLPRVRSPAAVKVSTAVGRTVTSGCRPVQIPPPWLARTCPSFASIFVMIKAHTNCGIGHMFTAAGDLNYTSRRETPSCKQEAARHRQKSWMLVGGYVASVGRSEGTEATSAFTAIH